MPNCSPDCPRPAWPTLGNMCTEHYRELVIQPLNERAYDAQREWSDALTELYKVEYAMGERPAPIWQTELDRGPAHVPHPPKTAAKKTRIKHSFVDDELGGLEE